MADPNAPRQPRRIIRRSASHRPPDDAFAASAAVASAAVGSSATGSASTRSRSVTGLPTSGAAPSGSTTTATRQHISPRVTAVVKAPPSAPPSPLPPPTTATESPASPATAAMNAAFTARKLVIDRTAFSSISFSAPTFVNNIANRLLYPILQRERIEEKRRAASGGGSASGNRNTGEVSRLLGSDGTSLFGSSRMAMNVRVSDPSSGNGPGNGGGSTTNYLALAGELSTAMEEAAEEVGRLLAEEEALLHREEVRCKRVEIQERRRLATVRLGLEGTSGRLQLYENRVANAQAATAGIEQHLAQSNARVQRGKSVSQLLRYFSMFTSIQTGELAVILKSISKARTAQRAAVTGRWAAGNVSPFHPKFYTTIINATAADDLQQTQASAPPLSVADHDGDEATASELTGSNALSATRPQRRQVFRRNRRDGAAGERSQSVGSSGGVLNPTITSAAGAPLSAGAPTDAADPDHLSDYSESDEDEEGGEEVDVSKIRLHRAEATAVAAGLDRFFAARYCTESQVEWCQRILLLAKELGEFARNVSNVEQYVDWLRQELVEDLFHIIGCFNNFYNDHPQTATHQVYGRALLKTLSMIAKLYATVTPSNDALLTVFFRRAVNDLGVTLFSEWSPQPLPGQPPLPAPTPVLAMVHFQQHTDADLRQTYRFLMDRIRRDVIVVETIFGTTNTARQQLLSQVTEGVMKPFLVQQMKLAETHATAMVAGEGNLSPRSKRRCGTRVADGIAYHRTIKARLFTFFQDYVKDLKSMFSDSEAEFLDRYVDTIFVDRAEYSSSRVELELLQRNLTLIEENYTRSLHPVPEEFFDLRESHMAKMKDIMTTLTEVTKRVRIYAMAKDAGPYVFDLIKCTLTYVGTYLDGELRKTFDTLRADRDNWRLRPKNEDELVRPSKIESQQCGFRILLFAQSSLMSLTDAINVICVPLLASYPRMAHDIEDARTVALEAVDDQAERLLNMCLQAILIRSLSILQHYQTRNDFLPKMDTKNADADSVAPPCTRACTLFCYYVTRQFDVASEFIRLSNGQLPQRVSTSQASATSTLSSVVQKQQQEQSNAARVAASEAVMGLKSGTVAPSTMPAQILTAAASLTAISGANAVRARARTMSIQQLLYGDGGPSSFVRTLGVCLYRGISSHLKSFTANDRGALIYKQDVTAYKEALTPLTSTPGLGGAVVEVLFSVLKETSSLLIMPLDHIKEVKEAGALRLLSQEEKMRYLSIRQDVHGALKIINS